MAHTPSHDAQPSKLFGCSAVDIQEDFSKLYLTEFPLQRRENGLELLQTMEVRIKELEVALQIKESTIQKLKDLNDSLQKQIKSKEVMRMSQLELLAMRNVELEMQLSRLQSQPENQVQ